MARRWRVTGLTVRQPDVAEVRISPHLRVVALRALVRVVVGAAVTAPAIRQPPVAEDDLPPALRRVAVGALRGEVVLLEMAGYAVGQPVVVIGRLRPILHNVAVGALTLIVVGGTIPFVALQAVERFLVPVAGYPPALVAVTGHTRHSVDAMVWDVAAQAVSESLVIEDRLCPVLHVVTLGALSLVVRFGCLALVAGEAVRESVVVIKDVARPILRVNVALAARPVCRLYVRTECGLGEEAQPGQAVQYAAQPGGGGCRWPCYVPRVLCGFIFEVARLAFGHAGVGKAYRLPVRGRVALLTFPLEVRRIAPRDGQFVAGLASLGGRGIASIAVAAVTGCLGVGAGQGEETVVEVTVEEGDRHGLCQGIADNLRGGACGQVRRIAPKLGDGFLQGRQQRMVLFIGLVLVQCGRDDLRLKEQAGETVQKRCIFRRCGGLRDRGIQRCAEGHDRLFQATVIRLRQVCQPALGEVHRPVRSAEPVQRQAQPELLGGDLQIEERFPRMKGIDLRQGEQAARCPQEEHVDG